MSKIYSKYLGESAFKAKLEEKGKNDIITIKNTIKQNLGMDFSDIVEEFGYTNKGLELFCGSYNENVDSLVSLIEELVSDGKIGNYEVVLDYGKGRTCWIYLDEIDDYEEDEEDEDDYFEESSKRKMLIKSKKLSEKNKKTLKKSLKESEIKSYERTIKKIEKDLKDNGFEVVDSGVEKEKGFETDGKDFAEYWGYVNLKYKIADENECRKIKDIISGYTFDNSEDNVNCFEGEKTIDIKMGHGSVDEACSKRRKRAKGLKESTNYGEGKKAIKKAIRMLERNGFYVEDYRIEYETDYESDVAGEGGYLEDEWVYINLEEPIKDDKDFKSIGEIILNSLKEQGYDWIDDVMYNSRVGDNNISFVLNNEIMYEKSNKKIDLEKTRISEKRKRLSEKDSKTFNKAFNDFKNLVRDIAKEIDIDMYIDDIWTNSENEGKVIVDFDKKVPSQKAEALRKSLEDDIRVEKITKKDNGFVVIFKEKYRNLEESIKRKRLKESNSKRISFKQFKKLKESKMRKSLFSKRKLNESDSVTIEIDFGNYYECLRCLFKDINQNLSKDQLDWYTELGMEFGIDPNSMCEWIINEVELLSVEDIKKYKDLGDVSDEEAIDFAQERGYYMGEVNGDVYFLVPLGE